MTMMLSRSVGCAAVMCLCASASPIARPVATAQQPQPTYRASLELVTIDVQVSSTTNVPLRVVTTSEFDIRIAGRKREAAAAAFLHHDEGAVTRNALQSAKPAECVFGFHRKIDRPTDHYLVTVERGDDDRKEVKDVKVTMTDRALAVQWVAWRSPIRRGGLGVGSDPTLVVPRTPLPPNRPSR